MCLSGKDKIKPAFIDSRSVQQYPTDRFAMATTQDAFLAAQSAFMAMMQAGYFPQPQKSQQTQPEPPMHMFPPTFQPPHTFSMFPPMQTWINSMTTSGESISLNEEEYIIKALSKFLRQGRNHNEALNSLDGFNNHSAAVWKEHYLTHLKRLDELVSRDISPEEEEEVAAAKIKIKAAASSPKKSSIVKKPGPSSKPIPKKPVKAVSEDEDSEEMSDDSDSDSSSEELDLDVSMSEDERNMGIPGGSYTDSDLRLLARWFSTQEPDWTISGATASFAEQFPGRSGHSWREYYRRNTSDIDALVKRIKKNQAKQVQKQCGRPSWAKPTASKSPVTSTSSGKRSRGESPYEKRKRTRPEPEPESVSNLSWKDFA